MLISAVLATANMARNGNTLSIGKSGEPTRTTSSRARPSAALAICSEVSTVTTETATSM